MGDLGKRGLAFFLHRSPIATDKGKPRARRGGLDLAACQHSPFFWRSQSGSPTRVGEAKEAIDAKDNDGGLQVWEGGIRGSCSSEVVGGR